MNGPSILVIEDEIKVAHAIREGLEGEGYRVELAASGPEGARAAETPFDVILLDLMLPGFDGIEVLKRLRARGSTVPVLVLTARDTVQDRVEGLDAGADDYLVKPFAFAELVARIRALLRRGRPDGALHLRLADLELDRVNRAVQRAGRRIDLTPREFDLLEFLLRHGGSPVSREMIAREVWREPDRATPLDNVIDVHMARLRRKVDQDFTPRLIHTVRGVGFIMQEHEP